MSPDRQLAALIAARHVLESSNPKLLAWTTKHWQRWLDAQRSTELEQKPQLVAVAALSRLKDISLHAGLMQLLANPGLSCTVVLAFPTEAMARLAAARARRDEWSALVHMTWQADLARVLGGLSSNATLVFFPLPAALSPRAIQSLRSGLGPIEPREPRQLSDCSCFLGEACDFPKWIEAVEPFDDSRFAAAV